MRIHRAAACLTAPLSADTVANRKKGRLKFLYSDAAYKAVVDRFKAQGAVDLIAVNGYYVLVSKILNKD